MLSQPNWAQRIVFAAFRGANVDANRGSIFDANQHPSDAVAEQQALELVRDYQFAVPTTVIGVPAPAWVLVSIPVKYTPNGFEVDVPG
jgi:hypothetical protein